MVDGSSLANRVRGSGGCLGSGGVAVELGEDMEVVEE